jgi:hypothetical protein
MLVCDVVWQPGNAELLPSVQAEVFEEIATMDCPFEGIPTVPPRKDMDHMVPAFLYVDFASSCYRKAQPSNSLLQSAGVLLQRLPLQGDSTPKLASAQGEAGTV